MSQQAQNGSDIATKFNSVQTKLAKMKERFSQLEGERKAVQENVTKLATEYQTKYEVPVDTAEKVSAEINRVTAQLATAESDFQRIYEEFNTTFNGAGA